MMSDTSAVNRGRIHGGDGGIVLGSTRMEYYRDPKNQIQADIAYRLGMIAKQYRILAAPAEEDFSSTLDVCILQNLLTTSTELLKSMSQNERKAYLTADIGTGLAWGLRPEMISVNTFDGRLTGEVG